MMNTVIVQHKKRDATEWRDVDAVSWRAVPRTLDMSVPSARIVLSNRNGRYSTKIRTRDEFRVKVGRRVLFHGVLGRDDVRKITEELLEVNVVKKDYQTAIDKLCSDAYRQLGYSGWKWGSATQIGRGQIGGLRPDEVFRAGLGTHFFVQTFFENTAIVKTFNDITLREGEILLSREINADQERYVNDGDIEFTEFENVLLGYDEMPDIGDVTLRIAGHQPTDTSLSVDVSRGGNTVTKIPTYSAGVWSLSVLEGEWDASVVRNKLSVKITLLANPSQQESPLVQSLTVQGDIRDPAGKGDLGFTEGIIDSFSDPDLLEDEIGADFSRQTRLQVLQGAVKAAITGPDEQYPSYYAFIDDGVAHFRNPETFGEDLDITFSRDVNCQDIIATRYGDIINNLMYIGQGQPPYGEITLTAVDIAGLKNNDSIALYGEIQGTVQEKGIPSITFADKRARVLAKHLAFPQVSYEIKDPDPRLADRINEGDRVRVRDIRHNIDGRFIVLEKTYDWDESGLSISFKVSNNKVSARSFIAQIGQQQQDQNLVGQGSMSPPSISYADNFDKDHPVELAFWLPRSARIRAVRGYFKSSKFRFYSRGIEEAAAIVDTSGAGGATLIRPHFLNKAGTVNAQDYGAQTQGPQTAGAQSINGSVEIAGSLSTVVRGLGNLVNRSFTTSFQSVANFAAFTNDDLIQVMGTVYNDSGDRHGFNARLRDVNSGVTVTISGMIATSGLTSDSVVGQPFFIVARKDDFGPGARSINLEVQSTESFSFNDDMGYTIFAWSKHQHEKGGLANSPSTATGGSTNSKVLSPGTNLNAATLAALLQDTRVGYAVGDGGVGTLLYGTAQGLSTDYYSRHRHVVTLPAHNHVVEAGIFEPGFYPQSVRLYVKDYPAPGDNPDEFNLTMPFGPFGSRGTGLAPFEVESIDLSAAVRDLAGNFKSGELIKMWLKSVGTTGNPNGIGRLTAQLFIDVVEGVDD